MRSFVVQGNHISFIFKKSFFKIPVTIKIYLVDDLTGSEPTRFCLSLQTVSRFQLFEFNMFWINQFHITLSELNFFLSLQFLSQIYQIEGRYRSFFFHHSTLTESPIFHSRIPTYQTHSSTSKPLIFDVTLSFKLFEVDSGHSSQNNLESPQICCFSGECLKK